MEECPLFLCTPQPEVTWLTISTIYPKIQCNPLRHQREFLQVLIQKRFCHQGNLKQKPSCLLASPFFTNNSCDVFFLSFFLSSFRNPAYFSTPNTRTDMYPPLSNLSITSARQDDHSNFQLPGFSAGSSVTPLRHSDTYMPYSAGVSVTKTSPSKVSLTPYELEQGLFLKC